MGTLLLNHIKKQASSFLHEKFKIARLFLTDVSHVELLAEEATNNDPCGPDAKTMTTIAAASYDVEDYWRTVDIIHKRFDTIIDWKLWRQSYKALVLLEFLLTHGPEEFAEEFLCDIEIIEELGTFQYIDSNGLDWGSSMKKRSDNVLKLLGGGQALKEARFKALKVTKEIQGFGNLSKSPSSSSNSPSSSSSSPSSSPLSPISNSTNPNVDDQTRKFDQLSPEKDQNNIASDGSKRASRITSLTSNDDGTHDWDCLAMQETGCLLDSEDDEIEEIKGGDSFISGICSKLVGRSNSKKIGGESVAFRRFSDVGSRVPKIKKFDRQFSMGY